MSGRRTGRRLAVALAAVLAAGLAPGAGTVVAANAQQQQQQQRMLPPLPPGADPHSLFDLRRRLLELDKLLSLGSVSRARGLLEELAQHSMLAKELVPRRILLAQLEGDHARAIELSREALSARANDPGLWRGLATSLLAVSRPDSARLALDRFIALSPNRRSAGVVAVDQCLTAGLPGLAVDLVDSLRTILQEPAFLGRQRAVSLLRLGRQVEAARQVSAELRANPFNLSLVRTEILDGLYVPDRHREFFAELTALAREDSASAVEKVMAANLMLAAGESRPAWQMAEPLIAGENSALVLMQNVATLSTELDLLEHDAQYQGTIDYLLRVLENMMAAPQVDALLRRRAADQLAEVCEHALDAGSLGDDPAAAVERFGDLLLQVRRVNPSSERLYSAQIRLADYTRRELGDPAGAARRLERLLLDLDLPTEGVALTRLALGRCYLAAGDTARGRTVLTRLGRDPDFRQAGGYAHYELARLDLGEGHFATARDRFAVVAMDNPAADYANEALDLGLAIAEELDNSSGGPQILGFYGRVVLLDLLERPRERLHALETFVREATLRLDPEEPQHLLERGLFELARAHAENGDLAAARRNLQTIYQEHPDGRYPAEAMAMEGHLLRDAGLVAESRQVWNQLLAQYPEYLFIDDVRDELRNLP